MNKAILLSFDVEEFDVPQDFGHTVDEADKVSVGVDGLERLLQLLDDCDIRATLFCTAWFAQQCPKRIQAASEKHEIASHGYDHSRFELADLTRSKEALETITGKTIHGFRMARLAQTPAEAIEQAGYVYDSSENPTWLPGRYNNLGLPRRAYRTGRLWRVPISTMPYTRFPIFWLSLKNMPISAMQWMSRRAMQQDGYLNTFAHPWEFTDLSRFDLPGYVKRCNGDALIERWRRYILAMKQVGTCCTMHEWVQSRVEQEGGTA